MDKSLIIKNIMQVYNFEKKGDFADFLGIKQQILSNWIARNSFDIELIYTKCEKISAEYILTGKGEMLREKEDFKEIVEPNKQESINFYKEKADFYQEKIKDLEIKLADCIDEKKHTTSAK